MRPKLRVWLVFDENTKLGRGRAELLRLVDETGSLQQAVARLGMSYRAAWGYVRELEGAFGAALLEPAGPGRSGGTRLTRQGRALLRRYQSFQTQVEKLAETRFRRVFGASARAARSRRRPPSR